MVIIFELDDKLLGELEQDISTFLGRVIDISNTPPEVASQLDIQFAGLFGITQEELAVELIEKYVRELAFKANIEVACFVKEQFSENPDVINKLRVGRIILLK
jgi:hypothetical protein